MSVSLTKNLTFRVESGNSKYQTVIETQSADSAIRHFLDVLDEKDNTRILRDETVMARRTPKGSYIHAEWR